MIGRSILDDLAPLYLLAGEKNYLAVICLKLSALIPAFNIYLISISVITAINWHISLFSTAVVVNCCSDRVGAFVNYDNYHYFHKYITITHE